MKDEGVFKMKQKYWIRIAVVFFALMIALTIFSRAAASVMKAKVSVTKAQSLTISHELHLEGRIEAKDNYLQYVPSGLAVRSVPVTPGRMVEAGDVLFTVDTKKLQDRISGLESELSNLKKKDELTLSRAEKSFYDAKEAAGEEKSLAYDAYTRAWNDYQDYLNTHEKREPAATQDLEDLSVNEEDVYDETAASELKANAEAAEASYEAVVRAQDKVIAAAEESWKQTKEDLELTQDDDVLETQLEELCVFLQNDGACKAEYPGVIGSVFVEAGMETNEGVAVLIADASKGVRFVASLSAEDRESFSENSVVTLTGTNPDGVEESVVVEDAAVSKENAPDPSGLEEYVLSAELPGDLYAVGSTVSVTVDHQSAAYAYCIPLQALRQDGNYQYFVYVVDEEDTVLGKELVARRLSVNVLDKDEGHAAVAESVASDVIVSSNKVITDGSRVKIIE